MVVVRLEENPMITGNLFGIPNSAIQCDMRVEAVFDDVTHEITIVKFRPII